MDVALIREARRALERVLGPELSEIITAISVNPSEPNDYFVELPEIYTIDQDITTLMSLVARTANAYHRIARFAGMAKAQLTFAEGAYKHKLKINPVGRNDGEREKAAYEAAAEELETFLTVEAVYQMAERLESIARIKSESARKLLDKVQAMQIGSAREAHGHVSADGYSSY